MLILMLMKLFYDEDLDYRNTMEKLIKERRKLCPVKLEFSRVVDEKVIGNLCRELALKKNRYSIQKHHLI